METYLHIGVYSLLNNFYLIKLIKQNFVVFESVDNFSFLLYLYFNTFCWK